MDVALVSSHKVIWNGQNHCEIFLRCLLIQFRSGWRLEERKMPARRVTSFSEKAMCMMFTLRPLPRVKDKIDKILRSEVLAANLHKLVCIKIIGMSSHFRDPCLQ